MIYECIGCGKRFDNEPDVCPECGGHLFSEVVVGDLTVKSNGPLNFKPSNTQVDGNHYKDMPIQPAEFCQRNKLPWCESNVVKYVCRHKNKNGRKDIEKAIHYLELLLEWDYPEVPK